MSTPNGQTPILCIVGPTGTGKSSLALSLARFREIEVVNADSRQVYRDFPIITDQPGPEGQRLCPHHLYGFLPTAKGLNAGDFVLLAQGVIEQVWSRGKLPVLVGGTGLYIHSLIYGLDAIPDIPDRVQIKVSDLLARRGTVRAHRLLRRVDPVWAAKVHPHDRQRISRGLEVYLGTGRPLSSWHDQWQTRQPRYDALILGLAPDFTSLTPRLERRIGDMLAAGALEEARLAWQRCPDPEAPGWTGIGCAELLAWIRGQVSLEQASQTWFRKTRAYAKRQLTWFRKEPKVYWLSGADQGAALELIKDWP